MSSVNVSLFFSCEPSIPVSFLDIVWRLQSYAHISAQLAYLCRQYALFASMQSSLTGCQVTAVLAHWLSANAGVRLRCSILSGGLWLSPIGSWMALAAVQIANSLPVVLLLGVCCSSPNPSSSEMKPNYSVSEYISLHNTTYKCCARTMMSSCLHCRYNVYNGSIYMSWNLS